MKQFSIFIFSIVLIVLFVSEVGIAQTKEPSRLTNTYVHAGAGISQFGTSFQFGFSYRPEPYSLNFRALGSLSAKNAFLYSENSEVSFLYGRIMSFNQYSLEGAAGISAVFVSARPGTYSRGLELNEHENDSATLMFLTFEPDSNETRFAVGLPLEVKFSWNITQRFTWGIHGFANFNVIDSNAGVYSTLQIRLARPSRT